MRLTPLLRCLALLALAAASPALADTRMRGAVAAPDAYSARVAAQVLEQGGNAVDAAVAAAFTLAVTYPEAGNIGGGGFMTLFIDGKSWFLDYRETRAAGGDARHVPGRAGRGNRKPQPGGREGQRCSGDGAGPVGGAPALRQAAWPQLLAPAIGYAHRWIRRPRQDLPVPPGRAGAVRRQDQFRPVLRRDEERRGLSPAGACADAAENLPRRRDRFLRGRDGASCWSPRCSATTA